MKAEVPQQVSAYKNTIDSERQTYRSGYRPHRLDTRIGTAYLMVPTEPMMNESKDTYSQLFEKLKERGLATPALVISDAHKGLVAAIGKCFVGASWQRCKVHFMRNILAHVPQKSKQTFAAHLKEIWLAPDIETAKSAPTTSVNSMKKASQRPLKPWKKAWKTP